MSVIDQHPPGAGHESGFSLVELSVVLLLVAILVVVAATRLSGTHDQTFDAHVQTLAGSLQTAVSDFQANWKLAGEAGIDVPGWGDGTLDANRRGYPVGGARDLRKPGIDQDCADIWRGLLQDAPAVAAASPIKEAGTSFTHIETKLGTGAEWVAGLSATIDDATITLPATPHRQICQFISLHYGSVTPGTPKPTIFYDSRNGAVLVDLDRVF